MKVKAIAINARYIQLEDEENPLQDWLNDNPNAKIEHVVQTHVPGVYGEANSLLTTIFYRD